MLIDLTKRSDRPELMDDFQAGIKSLKVVYDDINRANALLGGSNITVRAIANLMKQKPQESYTIVDMGCGDGQMLRNVAQYCRKWNTPVKLIGIDLNADAITLAKEASLGYPEIEYQIRDILKLDTEEFSCDIVINTLSMHHFVDEDIARFINKFNQLAHIGVIINDLHRSRWAYYLFKLFSLIFIKTETAKIDGLISISKGFVKSDLIQYSKALPDIKHKISWKWAFRYVWIMQPNRLK